MVKQNSMESVTIIVSMVMKHVNAKKNLSLKVNVTNARSMDTNLLNAKPRYWTQQNRLWKLYLDGITTHGVDATTAEKSGTLEKIVWNITWGQETPLEDVSFVQNLVILPRTIWTLEQLKMKRKPRLTTSERKWGSNGFQNILRMQVWVMKQMSLKIWVTQASQLEFL